MRDDKPTVDNEVERALMSMRAGFLLGSEQVAALLAELNARLPDLPAGEREAVTAAAARLVETHERLSTCASRS